MRIIIENIFAILKKFKIIRLLALLVKKLQIFV
ncbi:MAG: hypothetical protein EIB84_01765 [Spiroplasma poulsonii]|nr:hypothetical protein [Spiroplasma poulsonii]